MWEFVKLGECLRLSAKLSNLSNMIWCSCCPCHVLRFFGEALKDFDSDILWATMCTSRDAAQHEIADFLGQLHVAHRQFQTRLRRNFLWLYQPALGSLAVSRTCNVCPWLRTLLQMISSNFCQDIRAAGLVPNHAYSLIDVRILIIFISLFCWMACLQCLRNIKFDRGVGCSWCRPLTQTLSFMESHQFYNHVRRSLKQDEVSYSEILLRLSYLHTGITNLFCCLKILSCSIMVDIGLSFLAWPTLNNFVMFHIWRNKTLETETLTPAPPLPPPHPWLEWSTLF